MPNRQARRMLQGKGPNKGSWKINGEPFTAPKRGDRAATPRVPLVAAPEVPPMEAPSRSAAKPPEVGVPGGGAGDPLEEVRRIRGVIRSAEEALSAEVRSAYDGGATWEELGAALGVTRQAAWRKYH